MNDASGLPLSNNIVRLFHGVRFIETRTDATGAYAFKNLRPDSYRLSPRLEECRFLPRSVELEHLTTSTTQDFGGFGPSCGGESTVNMGATSDPLTVSGHVRDAAGNRVIGARIDLDNDTQAIRFTGVSGGFTFHVRSEEYKLRASGPCSFTPGGTIRKDVKTNIVQDFVAGADCPTASVTNVTATGSVLTVREGSTVLGTTFVRVERLGTPAEGLVRLGDIAAEQPTIIPRSLTIAGNQAIERQALVRLPGLAAAGTTGPPPGPFLAITTAVAVGNTVVRFESQLADDAPAATVARFVQVGRNFTPDDIPDLHGPAPAPQPMTQHTPPGPAPIAPGVTASGIVAPGVFGELEVAAFDTANIIVYGTQNGPFRSTDGGQTVTASAFNKAAAPPNAAFSSLGDPTVAIGAPDASFNQAVYFAQLQKAAPTPAGGTKPIVAIGLYRSTDGQVFNNVAFPINCSAAGAGCVVPDQEHLAADRVNRAVTPTGSADQLYLAWRNFTSQTNNSQAIAVACSRNGGTTWTIDQTTIVSTGGSFPRIAVGPDGSFLVAYGITSVTGPYSINVQKFKSCASGFQPDGKPVQVKSATDVTDMPGLDRPTKGNYVPAFDSGPGAGGRIFIVYSNEPSAGNDDIHVIESRDGGTTWPFDSIVSTNGNGRKYLPWICSTAGKTFLTWYDRRGSSAANPDLTAYFRSSVFDNGSASSVGIGPEINVSGVNDPQCAPGFASPVSSGIEQTQCTNLPPGFIQGGTCRAVCAPGATPPCGTGKPCDFRNSPPCAGTETCQPGGGAPKYGDYNGSACALGTLFVAWSSATPPPAPTCLVAGLPSASAAQCCSGFLSGGACAPSAAACTANGGACGPGLPGCCSAGLNGRCQGGRCLPAITMYTGSSCVGPGCTGAPVTITYHQTGACNGFIPGGGGGVSTGPNAAYVIFGIERINNALGSTPFAFDPDRLFVQQATPRFFSSTLQLYPEVLGPFAAVPMTITAGNNLKFAVVAQGAAVVTTTTVDGAVEASQTGYFLQYNRQPTDPQITLVKSNASQTSFPLTQDCRTIALQ